MMLKNIWLFPIAHCDAEKPWQLQRTKTFLFGIERLQAHLNTPKDKIINKLVNLESSKTPASQNQCPMTSRSHFDQNNVFLLVFCNHQFDYFG
jgi:hypothetical protein